MYVGLILFSFYSHFSMNISDSILSEVLINLLANLLFSTFFCHKLHRNMNINM